METRNQLSDKLEVRLGGIYSLERISKESPDDYWTVMENLAAFVRERSRRNETERTSGFDQRVSRRAYFLWREAGRPEGRAEDFWTVAGKQEDSVEGLGEPPATDIAAVLTVIERRSERNRVRETRNDWRFDFTGAVLKRAHLDGAHLERAYFGGTHLEWAFLGDAHLEGAFLDSAHLEGTILDSAHLEGTILDRARLGWTALDGAHLEGAFLRDTHLERTDLSGARGLTPAQITDAHGDAQTRLPPAIPRPAHWPPEADT